MNVNSRQPKGNKKRKPAKECPNPLFLKLLERWRDEAKARDSKLQYVYNKAVSSMKKYPLPLESGKEATILDGIGSGIAKQLDEELEKHNCDLQNNDILNLPDDSSTELPFPDLRVPPPVNMVVTSPIINCSPKSSNEPKPKKKKKSSPREYIPVYRSGPYAIMIALLKASERIGYKGYLTKRELQQQAQQYAETSFTVPEPDSYYTAWSSMSTLIKKGLVMKSGNPARFSLTDSGYALANKLTSATATHNNTATLSPQPLPEQPNFSSPSTPKTTAAPKPRTPATPRSQSIPKTNTLNTSPQIINSPTDTSQTISSLQTSESTSMSPRYGKPSKDFLASYRYKTSGTEAIPCQLGSLKFWYVGSDGNSVDHQDKAAVIIDDEISFGYLVKCQKSELEQTKVKYKLDHSRKGQDGYVFVYIDSESIAKLTNTTKTAETKKKSKVEPNVTSTVSDDDSDDEMLMRPLFERLGCKKSDDEIKNNKEPTITTSSTTALHLIKASEISIIEPSKPKVATTSRPSTTKENINKPSITRTTEPETVQAKQTLKDKESSQIKWSAQTKAAITVEEEEFTKSIQINEAKLSTSQPFQTTAASTSCLSTAENVRVQMESDASKKVEKIIVPEYELKAGSFEIVLCVDFIETTGGSKTTRKEEMVKELKMNGVSFDVRKLNVGDFLWIAREKMLPVPGQLVLPDRRELVLDYIVERKRMDDLCSSIKDGRFKEQKFRLLNSGLKHPVYLVEDFGSMNFMSMPAQTLEQAIVNTQIGQEFFVKRTRDIKESAAYLTLMTRYLQTAYENKSVKAIKKDDMEYVKVEEDQVNTFLMTFQELNDISIKNRVLTVGELFGKQLLQIPGVAAEKVAGILECYPTLKDLLETYEIQNTEKEKENLLSNIKFGKTQRKIGPSVSKTVYQLYCTKGALS